MAKVNRGGRKKSRRGTALLVLIKRGGDQSGPGGKGHSTERILSQQQHSRENRGKGTGKYFREGGGKRKSLEEGQGGEKKHVRLLILRGEDSN